MQQIPNVREWFRAVSLPAVLIAPLVLAWIGLVNVAMYRSLGVIPWTSWPDGQPLTFTEEWLLRIPFAAQYIFIVAVGFLGLLFLVRRSIRWWVFLASLLASTPPALYGGQAYARYLWSLNRGGSPPWEEVIPVTVGFASACVAALLVDCVIDWLLRRWRRRRGLCVYCAYDLRASSQSASCPECGHSLTPAHAI